MRKSLVPVLLVSAAVLATLGASLDWQRLDGAEAGHGYGFLYAGGSWWDSLLWSTRPPTMLLILVVSAAWTMAAVALRHPRTAARLALPVAVVLAVPVSLGSSLPFGSFSRPLTADLTLVAGVGLWTALGSLVLAACATAIGISTRGWAAEEPE